MSETRGRASTAVRSAALAAVLVGCSAGPAEPGATAGTTATAATTDPTGAPAAAPAVAAGTCWSAPAAGGGTIAFADATAAAGLDEPLRGMFGHAAATADVDGDGWLDLFVGSFADRPEEAYHRRGAAGPSPDQLLLGGPDGFRPAPGWEGERARSSGASFADLDGDGRPDLVVGRNVRASTAVGAVPTTVYRNVDGRLEPAETILPRTSARAVGVLDADGDGRLDLFVVEDRFSGGSSRLLRNDGGFHFTDVTEAMGIPADLDGLAAAVVDLDGDGRLDVAVPGDERVLLGTSHGFAVARTPALAWSGLGPEDDPAGVAVGDLDGDGRPDLVVGEHFGTAVEEGRPAALRVVLNRSTPGRLRLEDVSDRVGLPALATKAPHVELVDLDADGRLDLVASGAAADGGPVILRNRGFDGGVPVFESLAEPAAAGYWVTGAIGDFDRDGLLDLFLVAIEPDEPSVLLRGTRSSGHWLEVDVGGLPLGGIGAKVRVRDPGAPAGDPDLGTAWVSATTGYAAGPAPVARFGLGTRVAVDVVVETADGTTTTLEGVRADRRVRPGSCL